MLVQRKPSPQICRLHISPYYTPIYTHFPPEELQSSYHLLSKNALCWAVSQRLGKLSGYNLQGSWTVARPQRMMEWVNVTVPWSRRRCGVCPHSDIGAATCRRHTQHGRHGRRQSWRRRLICPAALPDERYTVMKSATLLLMIARQYIL